MIPFRERTSRGKIGKSCRNSSDFISFLPITAALCSHSALILSQKRTSGYGRRSFQLYVPMFRAESSLGQTEHSSALSLQLGDCSLGRHLLGLFFAVSLAAAGHFPVQIHLYKEALVMVGALLAGQAVL